MSGGEHLSRSRTGDLEAHLADPRDAADALRARDRSSKVPALLRAPGRDPCVHLGDFYQAVHRYPSQIGLASAYG